MEEIIKEIAELLDTQEVVFLHKETHEILSYPIADGPTDEEFDYIEQEEAAINYQAMKRMGQPEEIAEIVLWSCSDQASFITGLAMPADGGALA
jgi:NAD(P)-dependent dehydrogenase (short-subunit alcohol dehydrogenase family)